MRDATISDTQDGTLDQPSLFDTERPRHHTRSSIGTSTDTRGETAPRPRWFFEHLLTTAEAFQLACTGRPVTNPFAQRTRDDNDADVARLGAELAAIDHPDTPTRSAPVERVHDHRGRSR